MVAVFGALRNILIGVADGFLEGAHGGFKEPETPPVVGYAQSMIGFYRE